MMDLKLENRLLPELLSLLEEYKFQLKFYEDMGDIAIDEEVNQARDDINSIFRVIRKRRNAE